MMKVLVIAAMIAVTSTAQAQVYRCTVDGKVLFSDLPCPSGAEAKTVRIFDGGPSAADAAAALDRVLRMREQAELERAQKDEQARARSEEALERLKHMARSREAVNQGQIFVGMSADDARKSWGAPTTINRSDYGSGAQEQWVYRHGPGKSQYVYVKGGRVTAVQE